VKEKTIRIRDPHVALFNRIAPVYRLFFRYQTRQFEKIIPLVFRSVPLRREDTVLDIGCGTGALTTLLGRMGYRTVGIDPSPLMIHYAVKKAIHGIQMYCVADGASFLPFRDRSFDMVIATYVLHGLSSDKRMKLMKEARRISRGRVIFHDYFKRSPLTDIVEWFEGGDYRGFVAHGGREMREVFSSVETVQTYGNMAWYICAG